MIITHERAPTWLRMDSPHLLGSCMSVIPQRAMCFIMSISGTEAGSSLCFDSPSHSVSLCVSRLVCATIRLSLWDVVM